MPKTYRRLWNPFIDISNLLHAWHGARRGKRGVPEVAEWEINAEERLFELQAHLANGTYQPGAYHNFFLREHGKKRLISAAPFTDRVVHHGLCQIIMPIWEARFHDHSYACRVGKGTHRAVQRCQDLARKYQYVLQCDVREFFPSIDHQILLQILQTHIADQRILDLSSQILQAGEDILRSEYTPVLFAGDDLFALGRARGLPIGNLTSQFWANVYLHPLDMFVAHDLKCTGYVRYCDDILLFSNHKQQLQRWKQQLIDKLATLRLTLHSARAQVYPVKVGIPWLGWVVYPRCKLLKRERGIAFQQRFKLQKQLCKAGIIDFNQLTASVQGWVAHVAQGDTWGLRRSILEVPL